MKVIHEALDVNFVYDSAIEINVPYHGKPMKDIIKGSRIELVRNDGLGIDTISSSL